MATKKNTKPQSKPQIKGKPLGDGARNVKGAAAGATATPTITCKNTDPSGAASNPAKSGGWCGNPPFDGKLG